jgi:hypothetical protein
MTFYKEHKNALRIFLCLGLIYVGASRKLPVIHMENTSDCFFNGLQFSMTAELSRQYDLIPLIISSIAVIIIFAFINARQHAIIEIFIKIVIAFFTLETRKARLDIRDNDKFTELKDEGPSILVKKKACLKKKGNI